MITGHHISYNANPINRRAGDCTIRAISKVMDQDWETTYIGLCVEGYMLCDMPSANHVWGAYLRRHGFRRIPMECECPECYTVRDFAEEHPKGRYVLALSGHTVAVISGNYYDTFDSGDEAVVYVWYKESDI